MESPANAPTATLKFPLVFAKRAWRPNPTFSVQPWFDCIALAPIATLPTPEVLATRAEFPTAVFSVPVEGPVDMTEWPIPIVFVEVAEAPALVPRKMLVAGLKRGRFGPVTVLENVAVLFPVPGPPIRTLEAAPPKAI